MDRHRRPARDCDPGLVTLPAGRTDAAGERYVRAQHPAVNCLPITGGRSRCASAPDGVGGKSESTDSAGNRLVEESLHAAVTNRGSRNASSYEYINLPPSFPSVDGHEPAAVPKMA